VKRFAWGAGCLGFGWGGWVGWVGGGGGGGGGVCNNRFMVFEPGLVFFFARHAFFSFTPSPGVDDHDDFLPMRLIFLSFSSLVFFFDR